MRRQWLKAEWFYFSLLGDFYFSLFFSLVCIRFLSLFDWVDESIGSIRIRILIQGETQFNFSFAK